MNFDYVFENAKEAAAHPHAVGKCPFTGVIDKTGGIMYDCSMSCMLYNHNTHHCAFLDMALAAAHSQVDITPTPELQAAPNKLEYDTTRITSGGRINYKELSQTIRKGGFSQI